MGGAGAVAVVDAVVAAGELRKPLASEANRTNRGRKVLIVSLRCTAHVVRCAVAGDWSSCRAGKRAQLGVRRRVWKSKTMAYLLGLQVAEGHGEGIGGVRRLRRFAHLQERAHHQLHLLFVRVAVTGHGGLHFARRIAVHHDAALSSGQQDHAAHLGQPQSGSHIQRSENRFHGKHVRREIVDQLAEQRVDILEDGADALFLALRSDFQCTIMQQAAAATVALDDSIAGRASGCGVYAEYAETNIGGGGIRGWACGFHQPKSTAFDA